MKTNMILALALASTTTSAQVPDWQKVENIFGRKGAVQNNVLKIGFPRSDLKVTVGEVLIDPALALGSWVALEDMSDHTMVMGDLVLLEGEVAPVMKILITNGVEVTALHNHILNETPKVMYMHFSGRGDAVKLAEALKSALSQSATPMAPPQSAQTATTPDWSMVESVLGRVGQRKGSVLQFGVPRTETIMENGMTIPPFMGMATAINVQMVGTKAATTGDFVLLADEVNPVVQALVQNGIAVTAIHSHMLFESPRLFFLHFWGFDDPQKLAKGLRAALDQTNSKK